MVTPRQGGLQMRHRELPVEPAQMHCVQLRGGGWWLEVLGFKVEVMDRWEPLWAFEHGSDVRK